MLALAHFRFMKYFSDAIAQTRTFLDEVSEKSWMETEVKREVNASYHELVTAVMTTYEDFYLKNAYWNFVAGQQEYGPTDGVPSDIHKIRRIELNYDFAANPTYYRKAQPINIEQIRDAIASTPMGAPRVSFYYVYGFEDNIKLGFVPNPDKNSTTAGHIWYTPVVADMVLPTDKILIPYSDKYFRIISLTSAGYLLRKGQQEEVPAAKYISDTEIMKQNMMQELEDRISDSSKTIEDQIGMNTDFGMLVNY